MNPASAVGKYSDTAGNVAQNRIQIFTVHFELILPLDILIDIVISSIEAFCLFIKRKMIRPDANPGIRAIAGKDAELKLEGPVLPDGRGGLLQQRGPVIGMYRFDNIRPGKTAAGIPLRSDHLIIAVVQIFRLYHVPGHIENADTHRQPSQQLLRRKNLARHTFRQHKRSFRQTWPARKPYTKNKLRAYLDAYNDNISNPDDQIVYTDVM